MRISSKGRYALAAVIEVARNSGGKISVISIANSLGISKIYLEQVFAQLKKSGVLSATKGSKGGYQLSSPPSKITVWDVISALESALVEPVDRTVGENAPEIETTMNECIFFPLDTVVHQFLSGLTIQDLLDHSENQKAEQSFMLNM